MRYNIAPFHSVNEITFDSDIKIVMELLGEAAKIEIDNITKLTHETRKGAIFTYKDKKLKAVTFSKHIDVWLDNINLMQQKNVIKNLKILNKNVVKQSDKTTFLFPELGLILSGFGRKKIPEGKLIIVFSKDMLPVYQHYGNV